MKFFTDVFGCKHKLNSLYGYLKTQEDSISLSFRGLESFFVLYDINFIVPNKTIVRMDDGNIGQHYLVLNRRKFEGIEFHAYSGVEGIHNIESCFEEVDLFSLEGVYIPTIYDINNRNWDIIRENNNNS